MPDGVGVGVTVGARDLDNVTLSEVVGLREGAADPDPDPVTDPVGLVELVTDPEGVIDPV